ncbi:MAG: GatB/YqeY domain-containing protein [Alcaligenaceae bacterium]|nr:GatB/YqeY domain-containing protein [Alcaligenaceae bacterium]
MSDSLKDKITNATKDAMRARDSARLGTLRLLQAAIKQREVDERIELSDDDVVTIIDKQIKQRRESIQAYEKAGRSETAAAEQAEIDVLSEFMPEQADAAEISALIDDVLAQLSADGISGGAAMGRAMGAIKPKLAGRADMSEVSKILKEKLNP